MAGVRKTPYYWNNDGIEVDQEFRPPLSDVADAPQLGEGSIRYNDTTGVPEYWNGTEWVAVGILGNVIVLAFESAPFASSAITEAYLNSTYVSPVPLPGSQVTFTNITDTGFTSGVIVATKYDTDKWYITVVGNKF